MLLRALLLWALLFVDAQAGTVRLAWLASASPEATGYQVHYGTATGTYTVIVDVGQLTSWTKTGLTNGTTYYFAVKAYNSNYSLFSVFSNEVSVLPSP